MTKRNFKISLTVKWKKCLKSSNYILWFLFLFSVTNLSAQETSEVRGVKGSAIMSEDETPSQAKAQALKNAKSNALRKAGIPESIKSYELLFTSEQNNNFSQFFASDIQSEMQGAIKSHVVTDIKLSVENNITTYDVTIDATVIEYNTKPDPSFDAQIVGVKGSYNNNDKLTFTVRTTQPSYLTIFNITDKEAFVLFPNNYEKYTLLIKSVLYNFPMAKIDYNLDTELKNETNQLIFVFTKKPIPFIKMKMDENQTTTQEDIFSWIYSIMPDQRKTEYLTFLITK